MLVLLTAAAAFSTVLVLPGQQGHVAPGDGLSRLEQRLLESRGPGARWARLLRTLLPRPGLELQVSAQKLRPSPVSAHPL